MAFLEGKCKILWRGAFISVFLILIGWIIFKDVQRRAGEKRLLDWIKVSVIEVFDTAPPGLLVEVVNSGPRPVGRTHFRLVFSLGDRTVCRVDTDHGNFLPEEKRSILLRRAISDFNSGRRREEGSKITFLLHVFPEWKKALEPLRGEFILK